MVAVALFLSLIGSVSSCVPTRPPTTTPPSTTTWPCCAMLSTATLSKRTPTNPNNYQQCSILRRMSSTCPVDGIVFCDAAPDTNPTGMQVEFFNAAGNVVRTVTNSGNSLAVRVVCVNGVWNVANGGVNFPISSVSCAQTGSIGRDAGYVTGTAVN